MIPQLLGLGSRTDNYRLCFLRLAAELEKREFSDAIFFFLAKWGKVEDNPLKWFRNGIISHDLPRKPRCR